MAPPLALRAACAGLALVAVAGPSAPQETPFQTPRVRARLLLDDSALAPGESTWGLLELKAQSGWHVYWQQPGDSGEPPRLDWQLPPGLRAEPLQHPAPELYREGPLAQFVHSGVVGLPFVLSATEDFAAPAPGESGWTLTASASWLVCREVCEFEMQDLEVSIGWRAPDREADADAGPAADRPPAPADASIAAAVAKLPVRLDPEAWRAERSPDGAHWRFELGPLPAAAAERLPAGSRDWRAFERAEFFPVHADVVPFGVPVTGFRSQEVSLAFATAATPVGPGAASPDARPLGVLSLHGPDGLSLAVELPTAPSPPSELAPGDARTAPPSRSASF